MITQTTLEVPLIVPLTLKKKRGLYVYVSVGTQWNISFFNLKVGVIGLPSLCYNTQCQRLGETSCQ